MIFTDKFPYYLEIVMIRKRISSKAIVICKDGDDKAGGKGSCFHEITDKDIVTVGSKSVCDLQILDSDSLTVIRLKIFQIQINRQADWMLKKQTLS